ncbi:MAG: WecB/TagA/CpsF family glycosyltransferase [Bacteroidales bacterium]|nr:WecB/TagA/CpsF family glycosyltransferase [Bacteroidales bacterium]
MGNRVPFYHLTLDLMNSVQALGSFRKMLSEKRAKTNLLYFLNAHCFNISLINHEYYKALRGTDLLFNDGIGIKLGAFLKRIDLIENLNGTDLIPKIIKLAFDLNKKIYLLGAREGVADNAANNLRAQYPGIQIVGVSSGFFGDDSELIAKINQSKADLLIVGMGVPRQEIWLKEHSHKLESVKLAVAGGAILDFISNKVKRAPFWVRKAGFEWAFRFIQEPSRLFKRYFYGNFLFLYLLIFTRPNVSNLKEMNATREGLLLKQLL